MESRQSLINCLRGEQLLNYLLHKTIRYGMINGFYGDGLINQRENFDKNY